MKSSDTTTEPIYSTLASDPDLAELVETFVEAIPVRIASLMEAFDSGDETKLETCAHQLKGTLGSYGFDALTPFAADLEQSVARGDDAETIEKALNSFVANCGRIRKGEAEG
jgi:HPt (histidine-containing phosphotransfer) domain-containing protein